MLFVKILRMIVLCLIILLVYPATAEETPGFSNTYSTVTEEYTTVDNTDSADTTTYDWRRDIADDMDDDSDEDFSNMPEGSTYMPDDNTDMPEDNTDMPEDSTAIPEFTNMPATGGVSESTGSNNGNTDSSMLPVTDANTGEDSDPRDDSGHSNWSTNSLPDEYLNDVSTTPESEDVSTAIPILTTPAGCDEDLVAIGDDCYYVSQEEKPQKKAVETCMEMGLLLLTIDSEEENELIKNYLYNNGGGRDYWMGLKKKGGVYVWRNSIGLVRADIFDWASKKGRGKCAGMMAKFGYQWQLVKKCSKSLRFICKEE